MTANEQGRRGARNVVLVRLRNENLNLITPPLGIGYLLKSLQRVEGVTPVFIDCQIDRRREQPLADRLARLDPLLVGVTLFSADYGRFRRVFPELAAAVPGARWAAGGPHPSGLPEYMLATHPELDFVVRGEGEEALPQLVRALLAGDVERVLPDIPNLVYRRDGRIVQNRAAFVDVKAWGAPAWDLLRPDRYPPVQHGTFHRSTRVVPIMTSRGCPYPCTFCAGYLLTGRKIRLRDVADVADEMEYLQRAHGFREFIVEDENFTFHKHHVLAFADEVKRRGIHAHFSFPNGLRLDRLDEEIVRRLREMGTYMVTLGIESGSKATLERMRKDWNLEEIREKTAMLRRHGIIVLGSFILGFRDETLDDLNRTIDFALSLPIDTAYFGNYLPLPGTEDFRFLLERGDLELGSIAWDDYNSYVGRYAYHPRDVSAAELHAAIRRATLRFYRRPRILAGLLRRMSHPVFLRSLFFRAARVLGG